MIYVNNEIINKIKLFFDYSNIIYLQLDYESDVVLSSLSKYNLIDYVISNDIDLIVYGTKYMLKDFSFKNQTCKIYSLENILSELNININQLINLNLLLGCDYNEKIKNIKINNIFELVYYYKNLDNINEYLNNDEYNDYFIILNNNYNIFKLNVDKHILINLLNNRNSIINYYELNKLLDENINKNYNLIFYKNKFLNILKSYI